MIPNPIVKINGNVVHDPSKGIVSIISYRVTMSFMSSGGTFDIEFTDLDRNRVFVNDRIQIILDDTSIIKGIVDEVVEEISNESVAVRVSGRDYSGWWSSNDAEPKKYSNISDNEIIEDILTQGVDQLGYALPVEVKIGTPFIIKQYDVSTGKAMFDAMSEIANINNLYIYFDNNGVLNKQFIASTGTPVALFDLENEFEGTATITRSITDAKSDIWIQGRIASVSGGKKDSLSGLISSGPSSSLSTIINAKKSARKKAGTFIVKTKRPDNLYTDNKFRVEGRTLILPNSREGSTFRRRIITTRSKRLKSEIEQEENLQFTKTAPTFDIKLNIEKLYNIVVNQLVRVKYKDMDTNMVVHTVEYQDSADRQSTSLSLKLPGRIR